MLGVSATLEKSHGYYSSLSELRCPELLNLFRKLDDGQLVYCVSQPSSYWSVFSPSCSSLRGTSLSDGVSVFEFTFMR